MSSIYDLQSIDLEIWWYIYSEFPHLLLKCSFTFSKYRQSVYIIIFKFCIRVQTNQIKKFLLWSLDNKKTTKRTFNSDEKKIIQVMILLTIFLEFPKQVLSNKIRVMESAFVNWNVRSNSTRFSLCAVPGSLNFSIDKLVTDGCTHVNSSSRGAVMFTKYTQCHNVWKRERGEIHNDKFGNPLAVEF